MIAAENNTESSKKQLTIGDEEEVKQDLKDTSKNLQDSTNKALSKEIEIPENLEIFTRILFGLTNDDKLDFQTVIILLGVWVFFVLLMKDILELTPFFQDWRPWAGSIVVTSLMSIAGGTKFLTLLFFNLGNTFEILEKWGPLKLGLSLISIVIFFFILQWGLRAIKEMVILEQAVKEGFEEGVEEAKRKAKKKGKKILK
ncbi:MAG: hypothetical protein ACE5ES_00035 [Candidatus Nanoarchaeia archaeon]